MKDFLYIAYAAGLHDGLSSCIFVTCAVFILHGHWLKNRSFRMGRLRVVFAVTYAVSFLLSTFGPVQFFILQKNFVFIAKVLYFILGIVFFVLGILSFKEWVLLRQGKIGQEPAGKKIKPSLFFGVVVYLATIMLAMVLSNLATLWPTDKYLIILGSETWLRGQWKPVIPVLAVYVFFTMWPLWLVWAFLSVKNLRPSLSKIIFAAVFFTASTSLILMFK